MPIAADAFGEGARLLDEHLAPEHAQIFAEEGALDRLEAFASLNGPRFYGLPVNDERVTLRAAPLEMPERIDIPEMAKDIVVFRPDTPVGWSY